VTPEAAVEAFLHHLTVERGSAANTLRSYAADLRRYLDHLAAEGIDELGAVREGDITGFVRRLRSGPVTCAASWVSVDTWARLLKRSRSAALTVPKVLTCSRYTSLRPVLCFKIR